MSWIKNDNMAVSIVFELSSKPNRHGAYVVYLRVTQNRKHKRMKTSVEVRKKSEFNPKSTNERWVSSSNPNHAVLNEELRKELEKARKTYRDLKEDGLASSEKIIQELKSGERSLSFIDYAKKRTQEIHDEGKIRNYKKYNGFCNKLEAYLASKGRKDVLFAEITPSFLSDFKVYLSTLPNERQKGKTLHPNTVAEVFKQFKVLIRRAIEIDGLMRMDKDPFVKFKCVPVKTTKEKLDLDEIQRIKELDLKPGTPMWHSRNYFMFSYYCAGIRAGDLIQLRWCNVSNDGRLSYQMDKNHKVRDIKLTEEAIQILSYYSREEAKATDYIFPLADPNAPYAVAVTGEDLDTMPVGLKKALYGMISAKTSYINKYLKKVAEKAKIEKKVSMHIARHTFAKTAKQQGVDNALLKNMLGHSKLETTERYMGDFDTAETDKALSKIFATPEDKQKQELLSLLSTKSPQEIEALLEKIKGQ